MGKYKPCPHCGNTELRGGRTDYIGDSYAPYWWIECTKCPASMQVDSENEDALIQAWNKRT